ncbi:unnamed protein product [Leptidea sinapis]|uniref:Uncharacterized protein n=1 Tax=Leptidea sinapis TaxID=189913 RepID=A0A5E4QFP7_9NEOP|nr:unnamed protein product [Leptidea sinapis]
MNYRVRWREKNHFEDDPPQVKESDYLVAKIVDKITENRLRCYGHIKRRGEDHVVHIALNLLEQKREMRQRRRVQRCEQLYDLENLITGDSVCCDPAVILRVENI